MTRFTNCLITLAFLLITIVSTIDGFGFPSGGSGCGCGCSGGGGGGGGHGGCCGGSGGGGHGRRKRDTDAVQPHYMADETPCPQAAWKAILEESISPEDAIGSVGAIQTALYRRYANEQKFMVTCSAADVAKIGTALATNKVHFSSSGNGYCNMVKERIWCQAVALHA
ncbi:hypothetical protein niasHS_009395 [Heterodera schachtii]|uniref:Ground-like domain-containing protein n=2 Tax=Heterodera TaxID=34509 RepID=A0ABD2JBV0_HETSC